MQKHNNTPVQRLFITAFILFSLFMIFNRLPLPEEVFGFDSGKLIKIVLGITFCISGLIFYVKSKDHHHGR